MSNFIIPEPYSDDSGRSIPRSEYVARYLVGHDLPRRYWNATKSERTQILNSAIDALGYHRKSLIRLFTRLQRGAVKIAKRAGRSPTYSDATKQALAGLWELMDRPSERKFRGSLPGWLDAMRRLDRRLGD